ncbi:hypothetical protein [Burkholderia latens]|uniref:hypothetical protein n=1 Tax=Burkholderia latens TaxID=488446 RepID=UPI001ABB1482|nr:hypothetical protein [Burkholderia latens]
MSNVLVTGMTPNLLFVTILGAGLIVVGHFSLKAYWSYRMQVKEAMVAVRQCIAMSRQETKRLEMLLRTLDAFAYNSVRTTSVPQEPWPVIRINNEPIRRRVDSAPGTAAPLNFNCQAFCADIISVGSWNGNAKHVIRNQNIRDQRSRQATQASRSATRPDRMYRSSH